MKRPFPVVLHVEEKTEKGICRVSTLSRAPGRAALTLSKVALLVGDLLECFFGGGFLLVEEAVEKAGEYAFGVWCDVSL